jgi:hypothetical protein
MRQAAPLHSMLLQGDTVSQETRPRGAKYDVHVSISQGPSKGHSQGPDIFAGMSDGESRDETQTRELVGGAFPCD